MKPCVSFGSATSDAMLSTTFSVHDTDKNTYAVAFGYAKSQLDLKNPSALRSEFRKLFPPDQNPKITAYVTHDWKRDPFAKGAWVAYSPGYMLKYHLELQKDHGRAMFASADRVDRWRGFVDGALAFGKQAARRVIERHWLK